MSIVKSSTYKGTSIKLYSCGERIFYLTKRVGKYETKVQLACTNRRVAYDIYRMHVLSLIE